MMSNIGNDSNSINHIPTTASLNVSPNDLQEKQNSDEELQSPILTQMLESGNTNKSLKRPQDGDDDVYPSAKILKRLASDVELSNTKHESLSNTPSVDDGGTKQTEDILPDDGSDKNKIKKEEPKTPEAESVERNNVDVQSTSEANKPANSVLENDPYMCYEFCVLCKQRFIDRSPLLLGCIHTFCSKCILNKKYFEMLVNHQDGKATSNQEEIQISDNAFVSLNSLKTHLSTMSKNQAIMVKCPICTYTTHAKDIQESQIVFSKTTMSNDSDENHKKQNCTNCEEKDIAVVYCSQCEEYLCEECVNAHKRVKLTKEHTLSSINQGNTSVKHTPTHLQHRFCTEHPSEKIKVYCATCKMLTCRDCQLQSHRTHKHLFIDEAANNQRAFLQSVRIKLEEKLGHLQNSKVKVSQTLKDVEEKQGIVSSDITLFHQELLDIIRKKTNTFIERINELTHQRKSKLIAQLNSTEKVISSVEHCKRVIDIGVKEENSIGIMHSKTLMSDYLTTIMKHKFYPNPITSSQLYFVRNKSTLLNLFNQLGSLYWGNSIMEAQLHLQPQQQQHIQQQMRVNQHLQQPVRNGGTSNIPTIQNLVAQKTHHTQPANKIRMPSSGGLKQQKPTYMNTFSQSPVPSHNSIVNSQAQRLPQQQPNNVNISPQTSPLVDNTASGFAYYNNIGNTGSGNYKMAPESSFQHMQRIKNQRQQQQHIQHDLSQKHQKLEMQKSLQVQQQYLKQKQLAQHQKQQQQQHLMRVKQQQQKQLQQQQQQKLQQQNQSQQKQNLQPQQKLQQINHSQQKQNLQQQQKLQQINHSQQKQNLQQQQKLQQINHSQQKQNLQQQQKLQQINHSQQKQNLQQQLKLQQQNQPQQQQKQNLQQQQKLQQQKIEQWHNLQQQQKMQQQKHQKQEHTPQQTFIRISHAPYSRPNIPRDTSPRYNPMAPSASNPALSTPAASNNASVSSAAPNITSDTTASQSKEVNITKESKSDVEDIEMVKPFVSRPKSNPSCSYQEQGNSSFVASSKATSTPPTSSSPSSHTSFLGGVMAFNQQVLPGLNAPLQSPLSDIQSPSSVAESTEARKLSMEYQTSHNDNFSPPPLIDLADFIKTECGNSPINFNIDDKSASDSDKEIADFVDSLSQQQQQHAKPIKQEVETASTSNDDNGKWNNFWAQYESMKANKDDPNDDWCAVCQNGGDLLCCDTCPKVFHLQCHVPDVVNTPPGTWQCTLCRNVEQSLAEENKSLKRKRKIGLHGIELKQCEKILLELYCHRQSVPFHLPVKPSTVPNYHKVIKDPIDLSKIKKKLQYTNFNHYSDKKLFFQDIGVMFANCFKFNDETSTVYKMGKELEAEFKSAVSTHFPDYKVESDDDGGDSPEIEEAEEGNPDEDFVKQQEFARTGDDLWKPGQTDDEEEEEEVAPSENEEEEGDESGSDVESVKKRRKQNKDNIVHIH